MKQRLNSVCAIALVACWACGPTGSNPDQKLAGCERGACLTDSGAGGATVSADSGSGAWNPKRSDAAVAIHNDAATGLPASSDAGMASGDAGGPRVLPDPGPSVVQSAQLDLLLVVDNSLSMRPTRGDPGACIESGVGRACVERGLLSCSPHSDWESSLA